MVFACERENDDSINQHTQIKKEPLTNYQTFSAILTLIFLFIMSIVVLWCFEDTFKGDSSSKKNDGHNRYWRWIIVVDASCQNTYMNVISLVYTEQERWEPRKASSVKWNTSLLQFNPYTLSDQSKILTGIKGLFKKVNKIIIQPEKRDISPVFIYFTAMLSIFPKDRANSFKSVVRRSIFLSDYDNRYLERGPKRVRISTVEQQAIDCWQTVNYMLSSSIFIQLSKEDFGILDLDSYSFGLAFRPNAWPQVRRNGLSEQNLSLPLGQADSQRFGPGIFAQGYLGFGNEANILKMVGAYDNCILNKKCDKIVYETPCLPSSLKVTLLFGSFEVNLRGSTDIDPKNRFDLCFEKQKEVMQTYERDVKPQLTVVRELLSDTKETFVALNNFYEASKYINDAFPLKSAGTFCGGYIVSKFEFQNGAKKVCETLKESKKDDRKIFSCFQATYSVYLLEETLPVLERNSSNLYICSKLKSGELEVIGNGALGAALGQAETTLKATMDVMKLGT